MDAVYLTADILVNYVLDVESPDDYEEKSEAWKQKYEAERERHEQSVALINRIQAEELTVYLSDVVLFEAIKAFEDVPFEEEPIPEDHEAAMQWAVRGTWLGQRISDTHHILTFIQKPNVLGIDKEKWRKALYTYVRNYDLPLEAAYHAATFDSLNRSEGIEISGIVSFDEEYDQLEGISRLDPSDV